MKKLFPLLLVFGCLTAARAQNAPQCPAGQVGIWNSVDEVWNCEFPDGKSPSPFQPPSSIGMDQSQAEMFCTMFVGIYFDNDFETCMDVEIRGEGNDGWGGDAWASR